MAASSSNRWKHRPAFWELQLEADFTSWLQQALRSASPPELQPQQKLLFKNVVAAVTGLEVIEKVVTADAAGDDDEEEGKHSKKRKRKTVERFLKDPYKVWFQKKPDGDDAIPLTQIPDGCVQWNEDQDDIPDTVGGKLSKLSIGGLLNALAGQNVCERPTVQPKALMKQTVMSGVATQLVTTFGKSVTVLGLHNLAYSLHTAVAAVVKEDVLRTTPLRIRELLAPDMSPAEFSGIRKRIYDTVVLGKKLHQPDETELALPTAASATVHDIDKLKKCHVCGNNDQASFVLDRKNGDVICKHCGSVVSESIMHEGSQFRKFEGEVDRNHHGDAANPLFSNAHNMGTSFSSMAPVTGAGIGGFGSERGGGGKQNYETILKHAHTYIELNVSQYGKTDRRTRVGYKDRQKKDAFIQMTHAGYSLSLHEAVVQRAKELFSGFRDDRELVQQFKGVLAACLCESFDQLSAEGKMILRHQQQQQQEFEQDATAADGTPKAMSARAMRRMELHHANKAGKGGNTLNATEPDAKEETLSAETLKPAAQWDIENCRSWLLEACRRIAQSWVEERQTNPSKPIPPGPLDELEGQLIDHAIRLCEYLEEEIQSGRGKQSSSSKVATPRVNDMSKLSIKWQHAHERGSGGKGGVGGSGVAIKARSGRTAGQILILKSAKKLGDILEDKIVGEAIHKELRGVIGKQETHKRKKLRAAATQQRFTQMQRKPYLQARAQM